MPTYHFQRNAEYTREDVLKTIGLGHQKGGAFFTGSAQHNGSWFIFCNLGVPGRTGHNYQNSMNGNVLHWFGRNGSKIHHPSIQSLLTPGAEVHIFHRANSRLPFTYGGLGKAVGHQPLSPVAIQWQL